MTESKKTFKIKSEYKKAVPRLNDEEFESLTESIRFRGQLNPIVVNKKGIVLDGHHRFEILMSLDMPIKTIVKEFDNEDDEFQFVVESNVNRRQLSPFAKVECYEKLIKIFEKKAKENIMAAARGEKVPYAQGGTAVHFAKTLGMGQRRLQDCLWIMKHGDEKIKNQLRSNSISVNRAKFILDNRDKKKNKKKYITGKKFQCTKCFHIMSKDEVLRVDG